MVDETGSWINREEYFPYGETSFGSFARKRYRFTRKERDEESALYYHGARYYGPWLTKWTSCDPLQRADGTNLYVYVKNQPLNSVDRDGRFEIGVVEVEASAGVDVAATAKVAAATTEVALTAETAAAAEIAGVSASSWIAPVAAWGFAAYEGYKVYESYKGLKEAESRSKHLSEWLRRAREQPDLEVANAYSNGDITEHEYKTYKESGLVPKGFSQAVASKTKGRLLKEITKKHNDTVDRLVSELKKLGAQARSAGNETIKDASGRSIKGTSGTATWRKPDIAAETDSGAQMTGIEIKTSEAPATVQKGANQLSNERSFEGKGFFDDLPWTIGEGSGIVYCPYGPFNILPADRSRN